ncbi:MAG TPA: hypothetical protein VIK91_05000 [Nannocystis sp.]
MIVPKSREEVLKSFSPLLQKHVQQAAQPATKAEAAERAKLREAVERAAQYTSESIIKGMAELQVGFGAAIEALGARLASEASKLDELRRAITAETARLEDLKHVRIAAEALEILLQDDAKRLQALEDKFAAEIRELEEKIARQQEAWAKEDAEKAAAQAEADAAREKERKADEERYAYEIERQRRLVADEFAEKRRLLERQLAETQAQRDKDWTAREKVLAAAAGEIEALRTKVAGYAKELEEAGKAAREKVIVKLSADAKVDAELASRDHASSLEVGELRIRALEDRIEKQRAQIAELNAQLAAALAQTQGLAQKAVEGAAARK